MDSLHEHNLFPVADDNGRMFLYAPLCGTIADVSQDELTSFARQLKEDRMPAEIADMAGCKYPYEELTPDNTPDLTILINQRCNFSCRYCYSTNGRSNAELPVQLFEPLVKWFVNPVKRGTDLNVTFSGGGDPTLSMDKVRKLINMMRKEADSVGIRISLGMVCNGSVIKDKDMEFIRDNFSNLVISFDVIQEVHDEQRSHYHDVAATMRALVEKGVKFGLRSTITRLNVDRMEEMVDVLHRDFPNCQSLAMEAVLSADMWEDSDQLNSFYSRFVENYFKAQRLADEHGISLGNTIELSADGLKARACEGKVVVTPDGYLTACSRIATDGDNFFSDFIFGQITENGVTYDSDKYQEIAQIRADNFEECHSCFAKYHCGGGCMLARLAYSPEMMGAHCDFTRRILKHKILHELD